MKLEIDQKKYRQLVANWFAYQIMYSSRYEEDYSNCPPWDSSGEIRHVGSFNLADYETLESFLEEPTGQTEASYVSGCGFFHIRFEKELQEIIEKYAQELAVLAGVKSDDDGEWPIDAEQTMCDVCIELSELALPWLCTELFTEGEVAARKKYFDEQIEATARNIEYEAKCRAGKALLTRCGYTSEMGYVQKTTATWKMLREALLNLSENDLKLVSLVLPASNSITSALSSGKVPSVGQPPTLKKKSKLKLIR